MSEFGPEDERLEAIYDRLDEIDPNTFEARAAELLHGLGFEKHMMERKTKVRPGLSHALPTVVLQPRHAVSGCCCCALCVA